MYGGFKTALLATASLAAAGCAADSSAVKFRPIADPAVRLRPGSALLADARGQFALGNVALALEGFRRANREQPESVEALSGIAACYDAMGRFDLSQLNYEAALALAPNSPALLSAYAVSLDRQGRRQEGARVRIELAQLAAASDALDEAQADPAPTAQPVVAAASVTVTLPPARPAAAAPAPAPTPMAIETAQMPAPQLVDAGVDIASAPQPRLERLSTGEVALVTGNEPVWRPQLVARTARSTTVRWVPLRTAAAAARPNIRLLNAARHQGLAGRSREYLFGRGWRKIEVGDASEVRETSVVLYPAARQALGRSLAAQFGFRSSLAPEGEVLVVLLGRDATQLRAIRARG